MSLQWAAITGTSPVRVRVDGASSDGPAVAPNGAGFAVGQRVIVDTIGRQLIVLGSFAVPSAPAAQAVYVPGDDGSVWQVKAHSDGQLYTQKVS